MFHVGTAASAVQPSAAGRVLVTLTRHRVRTLNRQPPQSGFAIQPTSGSGLF